MARIYECIDTAEISKKLLIKICPVTAGRPTRMTEAAFRLVCKKFLEIGRTSFGDKKPPSFCADCRGKIIPEEVEFISLEDLKKTHQPMPHKQSCGQITKIEVETMTRKQQTCDGCGKIKSLSHCSGDLLCSSCAALVGSIVNRPETVAKMIIKRGKTDVVLKAIGVGQIIAAQVESELLNKISPLVGYTGKSGDELIGLLEKTIAESAEYKPDLISAQTALAEICRSLGIDDSDNPVEVLTYKTIVRSVAEHCAHLEAAQEHTTMETATEAFAATAVLKALDLDQDADFNDVVAAIEGLRESIDEERGDHHVTMGLVAEALGIDALSMDREVVDAANALSESFLRIRQQYNQSEANYNQLVESWMDDKQKLLADEQVFARIREVIEGDGVANGDLPTAISNLLFAGQPIPDRIMRPAERLDARLLGLLLDHPEIGLERIAEIREAA